MVVQAASEGVHAADVSDEDVFHVGGELVGIPTVLRVTAVGFHVDLEVPRQAMAS